MNKITIDHEEQKKFTTNIIHNNSILKNIYLFLYLKNIRMYLNNVVHPTRLLDNILRNEIS